VVAHYAQTPKKDQIFLDHVGWFVSDINSMSASLHRLGFVLTPFVAQHNASPNGGAPVAAGTGNRCAMLGRGYLEILTTVNDANTALARQLKKAVNRYKGIHLIALSIDDAEKSFQNLEMAGFTPQEPVQLRRPIKLKDGRKAEVAFTVLRVPPDKMEEGRIQMLRHDTPDLVWGSELIARDNAVTALAGMIVCVKDPQEVSQRFARFARRKPVKTKEIFTVNLDRGRLCFVSAYQCRNLIPELQIPELPFMAAVILESCSLSDTRSFFTKRLIRYVSVSKDILRVDPEEAEGTSIIIVQEGVLWP